MSLLTYARTPQLARDAARWNTRAAVTRATRLAAAAIKQGFEIVLTVAGMLAIVLASLALDVWILIPRPDH
jgi:PGF-CTERM motif